MSFTYFFFLFFAWFFFFRSMQRRSLDVGIDTRGQEKHFGCVKLLSCREEFWTLCLTTSGRLLELGICSHPGPRKKKIKLNHRKGVFVAWLPGEKKKRDIWENAMARNDNPYVVVFSKALKAKLWVELNLQKVAKFLHVILRKYRMTWTQFCC